ncbi:MAG: PQQ-binding-like beta-propeller repeat protein [Longimicrobiaceae bacterium]
MSWKQSETGILSLCAALALLACDSIAPPRNPGPLEPLWTHEDGAGSQSQPYADDQLAVFITAEDHRVVALDARSGEVEWERTLPNALPGYPQPFANVAAYDDLIIVPNWNLYALDRESGRIRWQFASEEAYPSSGPLAAQNGRIYTPGSYRNLYAVDARTGKQLWRTDLGERPFAPVVDDGVVYFGARGRIDPSKNALGEGHVFALDADDGRILWKVPIPDAPTKEGTGGVVEAGALTPELFIIGSLNGTVYGIDRESGEVRWTHRAYETYTSTAPYESGVAVIDGVAVVANLAGMIEGLDAETGELLWRNTTGGSSVTARIVTDGTCAYLTLAGILCIDSTGKLRWDIGGFSNGGPSYTTPPAIAAGRLFAGSFDGFHALQLPH